MEAQELDPQLIAAIVGGVIGILGSIAALVASHFLRLAGKITVNLTFSELALKKPDEYGGEVASNFNDARSLRVSLGLDFYNSSDVPRSLRELEIEIKSKNKKRVFTSHPSVHIGTPQLLPYRTLEIINIAPKELLHLDLKCWALKEAIVGLDGKVFVSLKALYPNGRKFKTHLFTTELK